MVGKEIEDARLQALVERRIELAVKMQELCVELAKLDLEIVQSGGLTRGPIAGTIGATIAGTIGATIASTSGLFKSQ